MNGCSLFRQKFKNKLFDENSSLNSIKLEDFSAELTPINENKKINCQECLNIMKDNSNASKLTTGKEKYDPKFLDYILSTIEELKNRVHYFENYFVYEIDRQKYSKKKSKQFDDISDLDNQLSSGMKSSKLSGYLKSFGSHKDFKYTVNPAMVGSEQKKVESDSSIIKSSLSLTKNTYININPTLDSKHFKVAAKDFIKQAEQLKHNISFILDNENSDNFSINDFESRLPYHNMATPHGDCESGIEQHLEYLLGSVSNQYERILKSLGNIEKQLKNSVKTKSKKQPKLSLTCTKVSTYVPNNVYKVETFKNGLVNTNCDVNLHNRKSEKSKKKCIKKLDPVVLVYEPIKPSDMSRDVCNYCGRGSNSCIFGSCRNHLADKKKFTKSKRRLRTFFSKLWHRSDDNIENKAQTVIGFENYI